MGDEFVVIGVEILIKDGEKKQIFVNFEVILLVGILQLFQILEFFGIGSKDIFEKYNIFVIVENFSVGENV